MKNVQRQQKQKNLRGGKSDGRETNKLPRFSSDRVKLREQEKLEEVEHGCVYIDIYMYMFRRES